MRGRACDLDVELGQALHVTVGGLGLFVRRSLRDLSSNRRKPGWLQPLASPSRCSVRKEVWPPPLSAVNRLMFSCREKELLILQVKLWSALFL